MMATERNGRLERELRAAIPPGSAEVSATSGDGAATFEIRDVHATGQRLVIQIRPDDDIQVEWWIDGRRGSPFETLLASDDSGGLIDVAVRFAGDVLAERTVLAYDRRLFRGGRRFLSPSELDGTRRTLAWVKSWRGTHDWER